MTSFLGLVALLCAALQIAQADEGIYISCYVGSWAKHRTGKGSFNITDLSQSNSLCTHWIYAFEGILNNGSITSLDTYTDYDLDYLKQINELKKRCEVRTLLSVGGWKGSTNFSTVVGSEQLRTNFVNSALNWTLTYGFDGLDIDWETPAQRGGKKEDKDNFPLLLKELRTAFDKHNLTLSAAVRSGPNMDISYDVPLLSKYLDFINIIPNYYTEDIIADDHTPMFPSLLGNTEIESITNMNASLQRWIKRGADISKILVGLTSYARTYTLKNESNTGIGAPTVGPGKEGPYTKQKGILSYYEVCEYLATNEWNVVWDQGQRTPYAYKGNQWIGYDNPQSLVAKINSFVSLGFTGVTFWMIDMDDFKGVSGYSYPLLGAIEGAFSSWGMMTDNQCH